MQISLLRVISHTLMTFFYGIYIPVSMAGAFCAINYVAKIELFGVVVSIAVVSGYASYCLRKCSCGMVLAVYTKSFNCL